jgi:hypothetical protein
MPLQISLPGNAAPLSILSLLINLGIGVFLSLMLRWHFRRFGSTLSNREEFAQVFPFILLTTVLIITVVKSSLALSLGLVGALSIVRFRTPIKEPEELGYLFIAIAMGLGLGANQTLPTVISSLVILFVMSFLKWKWRDNENKNLYLSLNWENSTDEQSERLIERFNEVISRHSSISDLRRFDVRSNSIEATYFVDIVSTDNLSAMVDELRRTFPLIGVTFIDQNQLPTI